MWNGRRGSNGSPGRLWVGVACLLGLLGCQARPHTPENRAEYFVEKLLTEPQATEDLRAVTWLAETQTPESLIGDLSTRSAVTYLRARARLGTALGVHATGSVAVAAGRRRIQVLVAEGLAAGTAEPVRFDVDVEARNDEWRVTGLHAD